MFGNTEGKKNVIKTQIVPRHMTQSDTVLKNVELTFHPPSPPSPVLQQRLSETEGRCAEKLREMEAEVRAARRGHSRAGIRIHSQSAVVSAAQTVN